MLPVSVLLSAVLRVSQCFCRVFYSPRYCFLYYRHLCFSTADATLFVDQSILAKPVFAHLKFNPQWGGGGVGKRSSATTSPDQVKHFYYVVESLFYIYFISLLCVAYPVKLTSEPSRPVAIGLCLWFSVKGHSLEVILKLKCLWSTLKRKNHLIQVVEYMVGLQSGDAGNMQEAPKWLPHSNTTEQYLHTLNKVTLTHALFNTN